MDDILYVKTFLDRRWVCKMINPDDKANEYSSYDFAGNGKLWQLVRPWRAKDLDNPNIKDSTELNERNSD